MVKFEFAFLYHSQCFDVVVSEEWWVTAQEAVKDAAKTPHIALDAIVSSDDLGRNVERSAAPGMSSRLRAQFLNFATINIVLFRFFRNQQFGHSKVDHLDVRVWIFRLKNEVLRLEVAVSNAESVAIVDRKQHLSKKLC